MEYYNLLIQNQLLKLLARDRLLHKHSRRFSWTYLFKVKRTQCGSWFCTSTKSADVLWKIASCVSGALTPFLSFISSTPAMQSCATLSSMFIVDQCPVYSIFCCHQLLLGGRNSMLMFSECMNCTWICFLVYGLLTAAGICCRQAAATQIEPWRVKAELRPLHENHSYWWRVLFL